MNKKQLDIAKEIFLADATIERLYLTSKGEFFTNINYAKNSVEDTKKIETITRKGIFKTDNLSVTNPNIEQNE